MQVSHKLEKLISIIKSYESATVAFSGGVDSSFLLKVAFDVLGNNVLAVTAKSYTFPEREYNEAVSFVNKYGITHVTIVSNELEIEGFSQNATNRCYICKRELFSKINALAKKANLKYVLEGSNQDDLSDFRPGLRAVEELSIASPLKEAGLTKDDIRILSKEMGLDTWKKPSFACLSSRFPYGQTITKEKLHMVDKAEQFLIDLGFEQIRVRHHGDVARIELPSDEIKKVFELNISNDIYAYFKELGFKYTSLDLRGYRTGSMNE